MEGNDGRVGRKINVGESGRKVAGKWWESGGKFYITGILRH